MLNFSCFVYKLDNLVFDVSFKFTELGKPDVSQSLPHNDKYSSLIKIRYCTAARCLQVPTERLKKKQLFHWLPSGRAVSATLPVAVASAVSSSDTLSFNDADDMQQV